MKRLYFPTRVGMLTLGWVLTCVLIAGACLVKPALADPQAQAAPAPATPFGTVWLIRGSVTASVVDGKSDAARKLHKGDRVYVGEHIRASATGEAALKTDDAGVIAIRPNTEFVAENFSAQDKPTDSFAVRLLVGSLRIISGWISQTNRAGDTVVTPTATIGIRGTDHEPYVLSESMAASTDYKEGTYDKVNRGGTILQVGEYKLDIDPGKVGFARAIGKSQKTRALMTLLLPVLLDKVPNFYVPGKFDKILDEFSASADENALKALELKRRSVGQQPLAQCVPEDIARTWLGQLDGSIVRRDASAVIAMFAPKVKIRATVRDTDGSMTSLDLGREDLAQSSIAALEELKDYKQRRVTVEAKLSEPGAASCNRIEVKSVVVEQGIQSGRPYRFESEEKYTLELQSGRWLAVDAQTTQK